MSDYKNLSVGKLLQGGAHEIYTVGASKSIANVLITFLNRGGNDVTISILKNSVEDGTFSSKPGYREASTYDGLNGDTLVEGDSISISYSGNFELRYTLVGIESDV